MLVLIQMIAIAKKNNQLAAFYNHVNALSLELERQEVDSIEIAETLEALMDVDLIPSQVERLAAVIANGSWKSAFKVGDFGIIY